MKRATFLALLLLPCSFAFGQGGYFRGPKIESQVPQPIAGLTIVACASTATGTPCTPTVSIFSNQTLTTPLTNLQTDGDGEFAFWIAPGTYQWCASDTQGRIQPYCQPFSVGASNGSSPIFAGLTVTGTASIATLAVTGASTSASTGSTTANLATSGFVRLATIDQECWRNVANGADVCLSDAGVAAAGTGNLADLLKWGGGGFQGAAFVDKSAAPAQSGVVRTGNNLCAVASRNAAANADVCAVLVDSSNVTNLGGAAGVKFVSASSTITTSKQIFTSNGTFTIPTGVTSVKVTVVGAGGAGGGGNAAGSGNGGGGAAGGVGIKWLSGLTPGNTLAVTVGTAGTGASGTTGNSGTSSSVASGTQTITTISANGGVGGSAGAGVANASGAIETAAGTGGDINLGGSGGGFAMSAGPYGGLGGNSIFGAGGGNTASSGRAAVGFGSGGGGAASNATQVGGAGAGGIVIFEWVQ